MATGLKTLIKLNSWGVDQKRRKLGEIMRLIDTLETQSKNLEDELVREQHAAAASPEEAAYTYGNYANAVILRRQRIASSIASAESEADGARDELAEAYRDLKKYETVQANRLAEEKKEEARKEQIGLDEIGLQGHVRQRTVR